MKILSGCCVAWLRAAGKIKPTAAGGKARSFRPWVKKVLNVALLRLRAFLALVLNLGLFARPRYGLLLLAALKAYQWFISPIFSSLGVQCRFEPSCSNYAIVAMKLHGPWKGGFLTGKRLLRCHPFCEGGHDPVPGTSEYLECSNG